MMMVRRAEHRWIVLGTDGRHVTLGRHTDPTEDEILAAESGLIAQELSGWLVIVEGNYWDKRSKISVMEVRSLAAPSTSFDSAVTAFRTARAIALQPA
jgi:hypothetical protein